MANNEMAEIHQRATAALTAAVQAAGQIAQVLIEARIAQLQRAARASEEQARRTRAQIRAGHQADAAIWRAVGWPSWWRRASADDISRAWRAASAWAHVDHRAKETQRVMTVRLAERGVHINLAEGDLPGDAAWLSDALDRAAVDVETSPLTFEQSAEGRQDDVLGQPDEKSEERHRQSAAPAQKRQQRMAAHVRAAWPEDRAERVIKSEAWPALAYKLDQLQRQGHDVEALLRRVPGFVDRARTPAAFAFRVVDDVAQDAARDECVRVDAARVDEREARTVEGQWRETRTDPSTVAETRADDARADADAHRAQAAGHEARAAQFAAAGYPASTKAALDDAEKAVSRAEAARPVAGRRPATATRPVVHLVRAEEPRGR